MGIWIVDNDGDTAGLVKYLLSLNDLESLVLPSGEACLNRLEEEKPALIITDINMPGMSGIRLIQSIRENPETAKIPVIACSCAYNNEDAALSAGADDFFHKPFSDTGRVIDAAQRCVTHGRS